MSLLVEEREGVRLKMASGSAVDVASREGVVREASATLGFRASEGDSGREGLLVPQDFNALIKEKSTLHVKGTREWAFQEWGAWAAADPQSRIFWVRGQGGIGKSVFVAELLRRALSAEKLAEEEAGEEGAMRDPGGGGRTVGAPSDRRRPGRGADHPGRRFRWRRHP